MCGGVIGRNRNRKSALKKIGAAESGRSIDRRGEKGRRPRRQRALYAVRVRDSLDDGDEQERAWGTSRAAEYAASAQEVGFCRKYLPRSIERTITSRSASPRRMRSGISLPAAPRPQILR